MIVTVKWGGPFTLPMGIDKLIPENDREREYKNQYTRETISDDQIIIEIKRLAEKLERTPTLKEAAELDSLPSEGALAERFGTWNNLLQKAGLNINQKITYSNDEYIKDLKICAEQTDGKLTIRKYIKIGNHSHDSIKRRFGSWKEACEIAGIKPGEKHGTKIEGQNGNILDSSFEARVADILNEYNINYETHKKVLNSKWITDFYIPSLNVWIEVNGYEKGRPNKSKYQEKLKYYRKNNLDFIEIKKPEKIINKLIFDV